MKLLTAILLSVVLCSTMAVSPPQNEEFCDKIRISNAEIQTQREGVYTKTDDVCGTSGKPVYALGGYYLYYYEYHTSWVVSNKLCNDTYDLWSGEGATVPQGRQDLWSERKSGNEFELNTGLTVECEVVVNTECDATPCKNEGVCTPVGDNSFTCDCTNTPYTGDTCEDMPGLSTSCGATQVTITIDSTEVTDIDTSHLHIGVNPLDRSCQPTQSGNNIVFTIDVDSCDPATTDDNGNIVYTYDILGNSTKETSIISRKNMMGIVVKCRYPTDHVLSTYIKAGISQVEYMGSAMGHFEFAIGMFKDAALMETLSKGSEVAIGETIFVKVDFTGPASLKMVVKDCIASPTSNTTGVSWPLLENGCYKTDTTGNKLDSTVAPLDDKITDHVYAFEFDSFRFLGAETSDVYITCDLHVCGPSEQNCVNPVVCKKTEMVAAKRSTESRIPYSISSLSFSPVATD